MIGARQCPCCSSSSNLNSFVSRYLGMIGARPVLTKSLNAGTISFAADISSQVLLLFSCPKPFLAACVCVKFIAWEIRLDEARQLTESESSYYDNGEQRQCQRQRQQRATKVERGNDNNSAHIFFRAWVRGISASLTTAWSSGDTGLGLVIPLGRRFPDASGAASAATRDARRPTTSSAASSRKGARPDEKRDGRRAVAGEDWRREADRRRRGRRSGGHRNEGFLWTWRKGTKGGAYIVGVVGHPYLATLLPLWLTMPVIHFHHARHPCGRPYDRWRSHTCIRPASRIGSATSTGQLSKGARMWRLGHHLPHHSSPPREDLLEVPDEGAEDEVWCLAADSWWL
ncbi:hypothetical protein BHM03_00029760 [Ensete ventricosum]|nr:hypothetical protein BHM03_00029760 [Ensete ventricosum]